jgi:xanthine dehydrogenase accessory factor
MNRSVSLSYKSSQTKWAKMQPPPSTNAANDMDIIRQALDWADEGLGVALATVIETWGSAPRPVGSQVVINDRNAFSGSVSGGCIEGEVVTEAFAIIRDQDAKILEFEVSDDTASNAGLACGGKVRVLVSAVTVEAQESLRSLVTLNETKVPAVLLFDLHSGIPDLQEQDLPNRSGLHEDENDRQVFARLYNPPLRLLIIGAVHIAQSLCRLGQLADYDVTVIDPRDTWGTPDRFPGIKIDKRWPSTALEDLAPDRMTAVVTLSHDAKLDDPAFSVALKSEAFYIGALGSRKTHAKRVIRLSDMGLSDQEISKIHAPIGLDIGANTPFEIALSIMGQIIEAHRLR